MSIKLLHSDANTVFITVIEKNLYHAWIISVWEIGLRALLRRKKKYIESALTRLMSRARISLSINGLDRRHTNRPKSDYHGIERVVAYQFDSRFKGLASASFRREV